MSPGAELVIRMCAESTEKQRVEALRAAADAMPHINDTFSEMDFFRLTAFALWFISQGRMPTQADWDAMTDFINGTEKPKAEH